MSQSPACGREEDKARARTYVRLVTFLHFRWGLTYLPLHKAHFRLGVRGDRMAEQCRLDDVLSSVSPSVLDSPCTDDHLKKLGLKLSDWSVVAMLLGLEESEIKDIKQSWESTAERGIMMLRKWRQSRGEQATYR